jgi:hypothetical protein
MFGKNGGHPIWDWGIRLDTLRCDLRWFICDLVNLNEWGGQGIGLGWIVKPLSRYK